MAEGDAPTPAPDGDEDEEEEYIVEAIRAWRYDASARQKEFLIKWKGYADSENTWEPEENLHCPHILAEFKASLTDEDRLCFNHPDPDGLTGFQRHATFDKCIGADGPHESDTEEDSGKPERETFYCLLRFKDSEFAEEVPLLEFFKNAPKEAFKFCEQRLVAK
jgi:hypothetical protein